MRKTKKVLVFVLLAFVIFYVGRDVRRVLYADELSDNTRLIGTVLRLINDYYVDEVKLRDVVYPAIKEMVGKLDPHSHFWTPEENKKIKEEAQSVHEYAGVGMIFGFRQNLKDAIKNDANLDVNQLKIEIKKVFGGSPAQKAGLRPKDEIVAIDGIPIKDVGAADIAKLAGIERKIIEKSERIMKNIQGAVGTVVVLTIKRDGWTEPKDFTIIRGQVQIRNVEWKIMPGNVGYLSIAGFSANSTVLEVMKAVDEFKAGKVTGVIIDLRNNPGGRLTYCVKALENFLPPHTLVVRTKGKSGEDADYTSGNYTDFFAVPIVVLINEGSASASEIMAGVLRDYKGAILIGAKTYGKGSVQIVTEFPDGSALWLTSFKYFLPGGECIHGKGIKPDIEVATEFDEPITSEALKVLKDWKIYEEKFLK